MICVAFMSPNKKHKCVFLFFFFFFFVFGGGEEEKDVRKKL